MNKVKDVQQVKQLYYSKVETAIGIIFVASSEEGVCFTRLRNQRESDFRKLLKSMFHAEVIRDGDYLSDIAIELRDYFSGERVTFSCSIDLLLGTDFYRNVWLEVRKIPYGEVASYQEIAKRVGSPKAARAIGQAMARNPIAPIIPCHRVIASNGGLGGYGGGLKLKEKLLKMEGAI